jgi:endonuclease YncB( thermonuclease family)
MVATFAPFSAAFAQDEVTLESCVDHHANSRANPNEIATQIGEESVQEGVTSWIADGDSIWVRVGAREVEVRLADLDAPERDQPFGWEAKLELIEILRGRTVRFIPREVDRHGRIIARVWIGELDVNRELVRRGLAWFYPAFAQDASFLCEERRARAARVGLWVQSSPQPPWQRRREANPPERKR